MRLLRAGAVHGQSPGRALWRAWPADCRSSAAFDRSAASSEVQPSTEMRLQTEMQLDRSAASSEVQPSTESSSTEVQLRPLLPPPRAPPGRRTISRKTRCLASVNSLSVLPLSSYTDDDYNGFGVSALWENEAYRADQAAGEAGSEALGEQNAVRARSRSSRIIFAIR